MNNSKLVRGALLVALALALQSLRDCPADAAAAFHIYHRYSGAHDAGAHAAAQRPEDSAFAGVFAATDCLRAGAGAAAVSDSRNLAG